MESCHHYQPLGIEHGGISHFFTRGSREPTKAEIRAQFFEDAPRTDSYEIDKTVYITKPELQETTEEAQKNQKIVAGMLGDMLFFGTQAIMAGPLMLLIEKLSVSPDDPVYCSRPRGVGERQSFDTKTQTYNRATSFGARRI